ncbi:MAG: ParA family protein [Leptospiraceae bacterium]|nr:ParA family protein [Leptospiraceae bacterium]
MPKVISIVNFKGGVGKTTTAVNLAAGLIKFNKVAPGKRVLLLDLDPQLNTTAFCMNLRERWMPIKEKWTIYELIERMLHTFSNPELFIQKNVLQESSKPLLPGLDLIPGSVKLLEFDRLLKTYQTKFGNPFSIIQKLLKDIEPVYEYVIIDTPPAFGNETKSALFASQGYVIPFTPEPFTEFGMEFLLEKAHKFAINKFPYTNKRPKLIGVLFNMCRESQIIHKTLMKECKKKLKSKSVVEIGLDPEYDYIFNTKIHHRVLYQKAIRSNKPVCLLTSKGEVIEEQKSFIDEFLQKFGALQVN